MRRLALAPEYRAHVIVLNDDRPSEPPAGEQGPIAVLPLLGNLEAWSSKQSIFRAALADAAADPEVEGILIQVKSPGGEWAGTLETAEAVRRAREAKPVLAHIARVGASKAYMIAAQATEVTAEPSARVGGVGVIVEHESIAAALEREGVELTLERRPSRKAEFHPARPLDEEARARLAAEADRMFGQALSLVARGRGWEEGETRERIAEGRLLSAEEALHAELIDAIETVDSAFSRLTRTARMRRRTR